jgi:hypothetical protein
LVMVLMSMSGFNQMRIRFIFAPIPFDKWPHHEIPMRDFLKILPSAGFSFTIGFNLLQ